MEVCETQIWTGKLIYNWKIQITYQHIWIAEGREKAQGVKTRVCFWTCFKTILYNGNTAGLYI